MTIAEKEFLKESNAIEGVYGQDALSQAYHALDYLKSKLVMDVDVVLHTHKILMLHQTHLAPNEKGYFRRVPIWIGGRKVEPDMIFEKVKAWCRTMNKDPWTDIGPVGLHIMYENIHPFVDGNGRTGRMFLNWQMLKYHRPIMVIKSCERHKYYEWFKSAKK